jgi:hypothetical protein
MTLPLFAAILPCLIEGRGSFATLISRRKNMKKVNTLILLVLLLPLSVYAAQIYGSLKEDGCAVSEKTRLEVICNGRTYTGVTDSYGAYNVYASEKGKCVIKVYHKGQ